jgi:hypothetical protein
MTPTAWMTRRVFAAGAAALHRHVALGAAHVAEEERALERLHILQSHEQSLDGR